MSSVQPLESGGLNTTLLQVFSMCKAFVSAGYKVTLAMQKNNGFNNNIEAFISRTFEGGIDFDITTWDQKCKNLFVNRVMAKGSIIQIMIQILNILKINKRFNLNLENLLD